MSALGQKQTFRCVAVMSALPPKTDGWDVRFVPKADIHSTACRRRARQQSLAVDDADGNGGHATIAGKPIKYGRRVCGDRAGSSKRMTFATMAASNTGLENRALRVFLLAAQ